ncbi:TPA: gamma-aminobutyrate permease, partial [Staphylococcus pseudintermedius]|nr:gamma-aminobutyrate permease [Staphylococcus pseudintermedius]
KFLGHIHSRSQLPLRALYTTFIFIAAVTIYANFNPKSVMGLLNIIGALVTFVWASSIIAQIRLRRAIKKQNKDINQLLPYQASFYPVGPIIVIATLLFLILGSSAEAFVHFDLAKLAQNFLPIFILLLVYIVHKLIHKTRIIPLEEIDLSEHESYRE